MINLYNFNSFIYYGPKELNSILLFLSLILDMIVSTLLSQDDNLYTHYKIKQSYNYKLFKTYDIDEVTHVEIDINI